MGTALSNDAFEAVIKSAKERNRRRDVADIKAGFVPPLAAHVDSFSDVDFVNWMLIRTAMFAIRTGIQTGDWDCVSEAYVFLAEFNKACKSAAAKYTNERREER